MISLIHRWVFGTKPIPTSIDLPGYGVIECAKCRTYLRTRFVLSLMVHMAEEHKMDENQAIETAIHVYELFLKE